MGFREYFAVIKNRWFILLPIVALVIGAHVFWVTYGQPQLYRGNTLIVINPQGDSANFPWVKPITPVTHLAAFHEHPILSTAIKMLTGELPFEAKVFQEPGRREAIDRFHDVFGAEVAGTDGDQLLMEMGRSLKVEMSKDNRILTISATTADPFRAVAFSWAVAEAGRLFHNSHCREKVRKTVAELDLQRQEFEKERVLIRHDRTEFARRTGFTNFPRYQEMVQEIILRIDGDISASRGRQREIERKIDNRVSSSQQGGDEIQAVAAELGQSARLGPLQSQLLNVQLEYDISSSRLTERNPALKDLKVKITRLEKLIDDEQESIILDGLKKWSTVTRDLVKQSASLALQLDVLKERKASMSRELFRLAEINNEYVRIEENTQRVRKNIDRVRDHINDLEWAGLQAIGQVQIHSPSDQAASVRKRGAGAGPITLSVLMALIFGMGVVYILEYLDTRIKNEQDVRRHLGLPLLGVIPYQSDHVITDDESAGPIAEKFNIAATLIRSAARELGMKSFVVSSAMAREGKTTVSVKVAAALARKGARVILVDADLRVPRIHEFLGLSNRVGLSTVLECRADSRRALDDVLSDNEAEGADLGAVGALTATSVENLSVLTSGPPVDSPFELLESNRMRQLIKELNDASDFVIFDSPPVNLVGDSLSIAALVDACIFVVGSGLCQQHEVAWSKHLLANVQANMLGVFLNRCSQSIGDSHDYYYYGDPSRGAKRQKVHV